MTIKVKVPNCGWEKENLADQGTGRIEISNVARTDVVLPVKVNGQKVNVHVSLAMTPWPEKGSKQFFGEYVLIERADGCTLDENGNKESPSMCFDVDNFLLVD